MLRPIVYNSAKSRQKCSVAERRELLQDNRRREKGATQNIGEHLPMESTRRNREKDMRMREKMG